jgi:putative heme transporter
MPERPVPDWLRRAASLSWRYLLVIAAVYVTFLALGFVDVVIIPIVLALFPTTVLSPIVMALKKRGWPPMAAVWGGILATIPIVGLVIGLAVPSFANGIEPLANDLERATDEVVTWLEEGPLQLSSADIEGYIDSAIESIRANASTIIGGVLGGATAAVNIVTGLVLMLFTMFYFLRDGDRAYEAVVRRSSNPERTRRAFEAAWGALANYVRGLAIVGAIDATFIGIGLAIVGTPLVVPLMILVFIGGFLPVIGAFLSGLVAVAVAFVNGGVTEGLIILGIVIAVQQFEGNVLYAIVFKRALSLHPFVILIAISIGGVAFGLVGAFLSVPIAAVVVAVQQALAAEPDESLVSLLTDKPYGRQKPGRIAGAIEEAISERQAVTVSEGVSDPAPDGGTPPSGPG